MKFTTVLILSFFILSCGKNKNQSPNNTDIHGIYPKSATVYINGISRYKENYFYNADSLIERSILLRGSSPYMRRKYTYYSDSINIINTYYLTDLSGDTITDYVTILFNSSTKYISRIIFINYNNSPYKIVRDIVYNPNQTINKIVIRRFDGGVVSTDTIFLNSFFQLNPEKYTLFENVYNWTYASDLHYQKGINYSRELYASFGNSAELSSIDFIGCKFVNYTLLQKSITCNRVIGGGLIYKDDYSYTYDANNRVKEKTSVTTLYGPPLIIDETKVEYEYY